MNKLKKEKVEAKGFKVATVKDFLGLTPEDEAVIEKRLNFDNQKYAELLVETLPRPIKTEEENDHFIKIVENLVSKGEGNLTPEESKLFKLLVFLIEKFEEKTYSSSPEFAKRKEEIKSRISNSLKEARERAKNLSGDNT